MALFNFIFQLSAFFLNFNSPAFPFLIKFKIQFLAFSQEKLMKGVLSFKLRAVKTEMSEFGNLSLQFYNALLNLLFDAYFS